jgi:hypothetical protein
LRLSSFYFDIITYAVLLFYSSQVAYDHDKLGDMKNKFWTEFDEFHAGSGPYENRDFIFKNNSDLHNGNSHLWHKKNTLRYTKVFGKFACRVCSKILGIGSAERSWGDVKHLKTNKRAHLSGERVKKQATIFGASCIEQAEIKRNKTLDDSKTSPYKYWRDDDFDKAFGMDMFIADNKEMQEEKPSRIFKAWMEDWEEIAIKKRDPVSEAKLLRKYGGVQWFDPDYKLVFYSDKESLEWTRKTKNGGGYCIIGYDEHYNDEDPNRSDHVEPWVVSDDLIECIATYYKDNPQHGVQVIERNNDKAKILSDDSSDDEG